MDGSTQIVGQAHPAVRRTTVALGGDTLPLELHVPSPPHRPGVSPHFTAFTTQPGDLPRPDALAPFIDLRAHATGLIRVLDDDDVATGAWRPALSLHQLRNGLEMMLRARALDNRMIAMQRQGRLSFYVTSRGEEASAVAGAMAYRPSDLLFPSYRQPGLFLVRGMTALSLICQCIGNRFDNAKGRQMPVHYSWRAGNVVSISSPVGTQWPQAVGAAMAFGYRGERSVVGAWGGDGTSAQGDFHYALNFASVYRPPCVLYVVDNQWAISTHRSIATGGATFAARADAYSLPGLRVDGNDFLAVYAVSEWAIERARRGGGPTLVELVTYRCDAHSTSDDPEQYRAHGEAACWPGGDPIERLKRHLIRLGAWTEAAHRDLAAALDQEAAAAFSQAEIYGSLATGHGHAPETLFDDVYVSMPDHLRVQRAELLAEASAADTERPENPPVDRDRRAVG
jgi:2-oxoisovalerate dehydrogenase E1 component alpha subunit